VLARADGEGSAVLEGVAGYIALASFHAVSGDARLLDGDGVMARPDPGATCRLNEVVVNGQIEDIVLDQDGMAGRLPEGSAGEDGAMGLVVQDDQTGVGCLLGCPTDDDVAAGRAELGVEVDGNRGALHAVLLDKGPRRRGDDASAAHGERVA